MRHIIDAVQVFKSSFVVHVLCFRTYYFQWVRFEEKGTRWAKIKNRNILNHYGVFFKIHIKLNIQLKNKTIYFI